MDSNPAFSFGFLLYLSRWFVHATIGIHGRIWSRTNQPRLNISALTLRVKRGARDLSDLGLTGSMGYQLSSLTSVTDFDEQEKLKGNIPYQLPPNAVRMWSKVTGSIILAHQGGMNCSQLLIQIELVASCQSMHLIKCYELTGLCKKGNLAHNKLNRQLSDMFEKLSQVTLLDLSSNSLCGKLPHSFGSLSSLSTLYLQDNQFTGPINVLARIPFDDL
ncbi:hypothetical protein NE237_010676 [Protea cynaroides]|uniref:Uncharacterized protein n=1 Tax=Protea cynaroides TaxID=273540 RepID=A0A9Q0L128_9MAGN|nr:hypothetical protein NE237_010676 [Protea cynaroides]